jgi:hypothetical protein
MLDIVDQYRKRYHEAERAHKHMIIEQVLQLIRNDGGRILERRDNARSHCWVEVSPSIAYRKIGHAFRSNARRQTVEKNAEMNAAVEAAITGRSLEEVMATNETPNEPEHSSAKNPSNIVSSASHAMQRPTAATTTATMSLEAARHRAMMNESTRTLSSQLYSPPRQGQMNDFMSLEARRRAFMDESSSTVASIPTPMSQRPLTDMLSLETRRRALLEEEHRLNELRLNAIMQQANARTAAMHPTASNFFFPMRDSLFGQNMDMNRHPLFNPTHMGDQAVSSPTLQRMGLDTQLIGRPSFLPSAPTLAQRNFGMNRAPMSFSPTVITGPVHSNSALVDMLLRRSQLVRLGPSQEESKQNSRSPDSSRRGEGQTK